MEAVGKVVLAVVLNYGTHYASMALHNSMCMPHSVQEVAQSLFLTASPACATLLTIGQQTQNGYAAAVTTGVVILVADVLKSGV